MPSKVFLSSTSKDLQPYRREVIEVLRKSAVFKVVAMEDFTASDTWPKDYCIEAVKSCDIFVGILGHLYGYIPPGDQTSITEQEHDVAVGAGLKRLMFVANEQVLVKPTLLRADTAPEKQDAFRKRVLESRMVEMGWVTPDELAALVTTALSNARNEREHQEREQTRRVMELAEETTSFAGDPSGVAALRNKYDLSQEPIGQGPFWAIYKSVPADDAPVFAVKTLRPAAVETSVRDLFRRTNETAWRTLPSPPFVKVTDYHFEGDDQNFVEMEFIDAPTAAKLGPFSPRACAALLAQVADAQCHAHQHGLCLGPLRPGDLFLERDGAEPDCRLIVKLSAFSIGRQLGMLKDLQKGQIINLRMFELMVPEIFYGKELPAPDDTVGLDRFEQYYLALLAMQLLPTTQLPAIDCLADKSKWIDFFDRPMLWFIQSLIGPPEWRETSPALAFVLGQLLRLNPGDRFAETREVKRAFEEIARGELPDCIRTFLDRHPSYEYVSSTEFAERFYDTLFTRSPELSQRFQEPLMQHERFSASVTDLLTSSLASRRSTFRKIAERHQGLGLKPFADEFWGAFRDTLRRKYRTDPHLVHAWLALLQAGLHIMFEPVSTAEAALGAPTT